MTVFRFALKRSFRDWTNILIFFLLPFALVFLPKNEWSMIPLGFQFFGVILLFTAAKLVHLIMQDRVKKTVTRIAVSPISHFQYLFQNLIAYFIILIVQCLLMVISGMLIHGESLPSPFLFFIVYFFFSLSALGFCLAWTSLFRSKDASALILFSLILLMSMVGGLFWTTQIMPDLLQRIAMFLPTYWLAGALEQIGSGASLYDITLHLFVLTLFTLVFLFIGSRTKMG
ncbi:ABC transporter permease [Bacillus horti]|uniref:ABC-2 type transport system permease protein n=1 Tax=Caldalkalibacillus horti TaxID=77523 RepID=A0ABT9VYH6_9BACI|nr:ABC transporter permease [Bacillus horti]MDQ0166019.1 ABC-2 type transport system permease protein [Bacillus horti]